MRRQEIEKNVINDESLLLTHWPGNLPGLLFLSFCKRLAEDQGHPLHVLVDFSDAAFVGVLVALTVQEQHHDHVDQPLLEALDVLVVLVRVATVGLVHPNPVRVIEVHVDLELVTVEVPHSSIVEKPEDDRREPRSLAADDRTTAELGLDHQRLSTRSARLAGRSRRVSSSRLSRLGFWLWHDIAEHLVDSDHVRTSLEVLQERLQRRVSQAVVSLVILNDALRLDQILADFSVPADDGTVEAFKRCVHHEVRPVGLHLDITARDQTLERAIAQKFQSRKQLGVRRLVHRDCLISEHPEADGITGVRAIVEADPCFGVLLGGMRVIQVELHRARIDFLYYE